MTTAEHQRIKALEWEVKELRRANEILKLTNAFLPRRSLTGLGAQRFDLSRS